MRTTKAKFNLKYEPGELVQRTKTDPQNLWTEGEYGLLIKPLPSEMSSVEIWKVLVGENIAQWAAYNFKRAFSDE